MIRILLLCSLLLSALPARGCPEIVVPLDPKDAALTARAWKRALALYRARKHRKALQTIRKTSTKLEQAADQLFRPGKDGKTAPSKKIQRFLHTHVYTKNPSVLIRSDRFTYPQLVWWAWADTACRAGAYREAKTALARLRELRPGADILHHEILVGLRLGELERVRPLISKAFPDAFLTPFIAALVARQEGDLGRARAELLRARGSAGLAERLQVVDRELRALQEKKTP